MDNRINFRRPMGPTLHRRLGDKPPRREQAFVLPDSDSDDDEEPESEGGKSGEDSSILSPQPRREVPAVSRVRSGDEAGQRIDLRG